MSESEFFLQTAYIAHSFKLRRTALLYYTVFYTHSDYVHQRKEKKKYIRKQTNRSPCFISFFVLSFAPRSFGIRSYVFVIELFTGVWIFECIRKIDEHLLYANGNIWIHCKGNKRGTTLTTTKRHISNKMQRKLTFMVNNNNNKSRIKGIRITTTATATTSAAATAVNSSEQRTTELLF